MFDFDKPLLQTILSQILLSAERIQFRINSISSSEQFYESEEGLILLDSICMQLIAIGESIKKVDALTDKKLLPHYPDIPWKRVMGIRDIISHHYFNVDAEVVLYTCTHHILPLKKSIEQMLTDLDLM